ncbi:MAG TPA: nitrilase-related carbon-nitrogen hydrolase [Candidatus Dormibacteraeota bacterium]
MRDKPPVLVKALSAPDSPARRSAPVRGTFRIGAVQERWHKEAAEHEAALWAGIEIAASEGARLVCLQELTMSPYFAVRSDAKAYALTRLETVPDGATTDFARRAARKFGVHVQASLHERAPDGGLGYNTAVVVAPDGGVVARVRKVHIPASEGYHEDFYFRPSEDAEPYPVVEVGQARIGVPTCWDQWFPELARIYALAGADVIVYPTAIGSEPDLPKFDTRPLWEKVIVANGIANGTFMVAVNRFGVEPPLRFYGSSFISDPYGRVLVRAPRNRAAVLVADLDLDQRRDWLDLFPFLTTRRPEMYGRLAQGAAAVKRR